MGGGSVFHLYLHLAVTRVHVVELLHTRGTGIQFLFRIKFLIDMEQLSVSAQEETEFTQTHIH